MNSFSTMVFVRFNLLPFKDTKETKLIMFQYKIIHHVSYLQTHYCINCKKFLLRTVCFACITSNLRSFYWLCVSVNFLVWISKLNFSILRHYIVLCLCTPGIFATLSLPCLALDHLLVPGKYFLYVNALNDSSFIDLKNQCRIKLNWKNILHVQWPQKNNTSFSRNGRILLWLGC